MEIGEGMYIKSLLLVRNWTPIVEAGVLAVKFAFDASQLDALNQFSRCANWTCLFLRLASLIINSSLRSLVRTE